MPKGLIKPAFLFLLFVGFIVGLSYIIDDGKGIYAFVKGVYLRHASDRLGEAAPALVPLVWAVVIMWVYWRAEHYWLRRSTEKARQAVNEYVTERTAFLEDTRQKILSEGDGVIERSKDFAEGAHDEAKRIVARIVKTNNESLAIMDQMKEYYEGLTKKGDEIEEMKEEAAAILRSKSDY